MDLEKFSLEDLLLSAMKSEVDSKEVYLKVAENVRNFLLKDKMNFLAKEEEKHRTFFESLFKKNFPGKEIVLPEQTPVPLPYIRVPDEKVPLNEVLESAMNAEMAAHDFYTSLSDRFNGDSNTKRMILYIASMEMGHYRLLEIERKNALEFEYYNQVWPMMHVGP